MGNPGPSLGSGLSMPVSPRRQVPVLARAYIVTAIMFAAGAFLLAATYGSLLPIAFPVIVALPISLYLWIARKRSGAELAIFLRSLAAGMLAAGIASYYAIYLLDPDQLGSDAWSFYQLSSQAGPARSLQDLQTITEGAGAVVLWSWIYDLAAAIGFPREPFVGITVNIVLVAATAVVCARSASCLYGEDDYRFNRLILFFTISGNMWLFAGIHLRDASILFIIMLIAHAWIAYLSQLEHRKFAIAAIATLIAMPILEVLRKEFFYVPLLMGALALFCLNFSRGRGDNRFITLVSIVFGLVLAAVAIAAFGEQIQTLLLSGQETYATNAIENARSGSLGNALIVEQALPIRVALGVPYLLYFPIPFWAGFADESALLGFKSLNALSFYFISAFLFAGGFMILTIKQLRSPGFLFTLLVPLVFSVTVALTSLESRHFGVFLPLIFLVGLLPDYRVASERRLVRFLLALTFASVVLIHLAWFVVRYA